MFKFVLRADICQNINNETARLYTQLHKFIQTFWVSIFMSVYEIDL